MKIEPAANCKNDCSSPALTGDVSRRHFLVSAGVLAAGLSAGPLLAASRRESYADFVKAHSSLRGYWRFDGNLVDAMGKAPAKGDGAMSFVEGAVDGKALSLIPKQPISVQNTNHLSGRSATLEMFFKVSAPPTGAKDPVLIAQTAGQNVRYIVGIKNDLSALTYRQERETVPTTIKLPIDQPIKVGRWYHLAITSFDLDLRAYVDGYECTLVGGALEFTRRGPKNAPMTFGATSVVGWDSADICLDEVACYAEGLTMAQIQEHLKAAGWERRLKETGLLVERLEAERRAQRERKLKAMLHDPSLTAHGKTRVYEGAHLDAIAFTVGGIGAGAIQFNGKAEPAIWQIACNYSEERVADSFLAMRAQRAGGKPVVRALQTEPVGPFAAMASLRFEGEYPFARYHFEEPALPVAVELEVFNPFIPMDAKHSAIPCVIYTIKVTNLSSVPVQIDIMAAQKNAVGYADGKGDAYGQNQNQLVRDGDAMMLHMTRKGDVGSDMVLMTLADGASGCATWESAASLHDAFTVNGNCDGPQKTSPSSAGKTVNGALSAPLELAPGESKSITYVLTWHMSKARHGSGKTWSHSGNMYINWWPDAMGVATYLRDNLNELTARTRLFHDTLYASNLPVWLLDRFSSQLAVLRSQTCWWAADGYFGAWEGCKPNSGCCAGNCTHVWHYAQAHARLFPELGRKMREQDFGLQLPSGLTPYRHTNKIAAADGFFGTILNTYREHLCSPDDSWLKKQWPKVKKAMAWGIEQWDPNRDGYLQNVQHNTLDGDMTGCSSWIGSLYLSSLEAGARMADIMGESGTAAEYRKIRESGKKLQNKRLWNGEYYIQEVGQKRIQDYLDGCHIDQILGEWWAEQIGIDRNYPRARSRKAMESLLKYNFFANFQGQSLKPRQFVTTDDAGMKMITWPKGPQPIPGMKYGDEVMTGFEYGAGVSMIQNGMLREGLVVIKAIADRYDGRLRTEGITEMDTAAWGYTGNPFGDDECGKYYGRSLSVWSTLLALQGFIYDGPAGRIGFRPRWKPENHAGMFTAAEGYGLFTQVQDTNTLKASIDLREGQLRLTEVVLAVAEGKRPKSVDVKFAGNTVKSRFEVKDGDVKLLLQNPLVLKAEQRLDIEVSI